MAETEEPWLTEPSGCILVHSDSGTGPVNGNSMEEISSRAEIDTSAPFESVREAVRRFGGIGFWKPSPHKVQPSAEPDVEKVDIAKLEEQAAELEKDLVLKERETLDVLKELEGTKTIVEELKSKLRKGTLEASKSLEIELHKDDNKNAIVNEDDKENHQGNVIGSLSRCTSSAAGPVLMELKQAKLNLSRTTSDLAGIRASVESMTKKLEKEKVYLEKTKERLSLNSSRMSYLEKELNETRLKLQVAKDAEAKSSFDNPLDISKELKQLSSKAERFRKMGEEAQDGVSRAISEVEQTKARMKTVQLRLVAASKMKQAARAAEAVALSEFKALSTSERVARAPIQDAEGVTISYEDYTALTSKGQDAVELCDKRVLHALDQVDEADVSRLEVLKKVEKATEEVRISKKALEEALNRVEAANKAKLAVEEALRQWRSEHGQRRRSVNSSTKFKHACHSQSGRDARIVDVNGLNLVNDGSMPVLKSTLSIGQILSRKLLLPEDLEREMPTGKGKGKLNVSLGQMLKKQNSDLTLGQKTDRESSHNQFSGKRKKLGLARFSQFLVRENKKKNKPTLNLR